VDVTLQYFDGCLNWQTADTRLRALADELGFRIAYREVMSSEQAEELSFRGSPTIIVDGHDPFPTAGQPGLACRIYQTPGGPAGAPTVEQLRSALA